MSQARESAYVCGCDPGAIHWCQDFPGCVYGKSQLAEEDRLVGKSIAPVVPHITHQQRANAEQARVEIQQGIKNQRTYVGGIVPSPDTFVDVARLQKANPNLALPTDPKARKQTPIYSGVLKYFPKALAEVARVSYAGNEQHNPGEKLRWAREKSTDQEDCLVRHLLEAGTLDTDGQRHSAKVCWRALAMLELELEAEGK